jgi:hypothetical protein
LKEAEWFATYLSLYSYFNLTPDRKMKPILLTGAMLLANIFAFAQNYTLPADPTNQNVVPPAPEAWAFMKYGSYGVSRESGAVNISIPLHTITSGSLSVPIQLSYQATGIRVDDLASWVGTGWDLNVGGAVSRVVKGYPDELLYGQLNVGIPESINDFVPLHDQNYNEVMYIISGRRDAEPDEFNFNVPGLSGKFYLDTNGVPQTQPYTDAKITYTIQSNHIATVQIIAPDGTKYIFGNPSKTQYPINDIGASVQANTTWYLLEMVSTNETDRITFSYKSKSSVTKNRPLETDYVTFSSYIGGAYLGYTKERKQGGTNYIYSDAKAVETVTFSNGKVVLNSVTGRSDDASALKLTSVDVYGPDLTTVVKGFDFYYDYFVATGGVLATYNYRLRLDSLKERGTGGSLLPAHVFDYETLALPPRYSFSQDYWGYYNGRINASLMPLYKCPTPAGVSGAPSSVLLGDGDRKPYAMYTVAGMLKGITYPTKGRTEFTFEPNDFKNYHEKDVAGASYWGVITPPSGGGTPVTDTYTYIPAQGQAVATTATYTINFWIQQLAGTLNTGDMTVNIEDVTTGTPQNVFYNGTASAYGQTALLTLTAGHMYRLHV